MMPNVKPEMKKDWIGSQQSVFKTLGSSHHCNEEREENDFYATDPKAVEMLLDLETFATNIWEPACGMGHLSESMIRRGHTVKSTDLINRGYGVHGVDFLSHDQGVWMGDIITNPPYKFGKEFIQHAIDTVGDGYKVAMFLKVQFLEGKGRKGLFTSTPPKRIYVSSSRINCAKNGDFEGLRQTGGSAVAYAWYVWQKGYKGDTVVKWFN